MPKPKARNGNFHAHFFELLRDGIAMPGAPVFSNADMASIGPDSLAFGHSINQRISFRAKIFYRCQGLGPQSIGLADSRLASRQRDAVSLVMLPSQVLKLFRTKPAVQSQKDHELGLSVGVLDELLNLLRRVERF